MRHFRMHVVLEQCECLPTTRRFPSQHACSCVHLATRLHEFVPESIWYLLVTLSCFN